MVNAAAVSLACIYLARPVSVDLRTPTCEARDLPLVCGRLVQHRRTDNLFRVGKLWLHAPRGSVFDRWLAQAAGAEVVVSLTSRPDSHGGEPNLKILTGTLQHNTAPSELDTIHVVYMRDQHTGTPGPVTFETTAFDLASRFDAYAGRTVSIIIRVLTPRR